MRIVESGRLIPLEGVQNFRDMGGYQTPTGQIIKWGSIYRSGFLSDMTASCAREMKSRAIKHVVDFRSEREKSTHPTQRIHGWTPTYHDASIGGNAAAWIQAMLKRISESNALEESLREQLLDAYRTIPIDNTAGLKAFFQALLNREPEEAILFHCKAGKDRTGIAGALLMKLLGLHDDIIMQDYMLTNTAMDINAYATLTAESLSLKSGRTIKPSDVIPLVGVEEDYLHTCFRTISDHFGSIDTYLEARLGISQNQKEQLKADLLTSP